MRHSTPGCDPDPQRRRLLAAGLIAGTGVPAALAQGAAQPVVLSVPLPAGAQTGVPFTVAGEAQNRVVFSSLRSTARIAAISLLDPAQRRLWRRTPAELGFTSRDVATHPEQGDAIVLPEIRDAASGRWSLLIERAAPLDGAGRLLLAYSVLPRFELAITTAAVAPRVAAGQPLLLALRPRDYGAPVPGIGGIEVLALDAGGARVASTTARENARSREGILLADEPGTYFATLSFARPGSYRVEASHSFGSAPRAVKKTVQLEVTVAQSGGALELVGLRLDAATGAGCARGVMLDFAVQVASAGSYACNLTLRGGDPALPRASASAELAAGPGRIAVAVSAAKLAALGRPWTRLDRAVLLQLAGNELRVVAERSDIDLGGYNIDYGALCK